jgi:hypothetical protein
VAIDIGGSVVLSILLVAAYVFQQISQGGEPDQVIRSLQVVDPGSWLFLVSAGLGTLLSFLGGYACAAIARQRELRWATLVGMISVAFGIWWGSGGIERWLSLVMSAITLTAVLGGAWANAMRRRRSAVG